MGNWRGHTDIVCHSSGRERDTCGPGVPDMRRVFPLAFAAPVGRDVLSSGMGRPTSSPQTRPGPPIAHSDGPSHDEALMRTMDD